MRQQSTNAWTVEHNTAIDVRIGFLADGATALITVRRCHPVSQRLSRRKLQQPRGHQSYRRPGSTGPRPLPYFGGNGANNWYGAVANKNVDSASQFQNNLLMNRAGFVYTTTRGVHYPTSTYLIQSDDPGRDPNTLFVSWQERNNSVPPNGLLYRNGNYRLASGPAALFPAYDARTIGADIDEIEAHRAERHGRGAGWPPFRIACREPSTASGTSA